MKTKPENYLTPFLERRVPFVAPWRALNLGLDLQITYLVPLRLTTWQSAWRRLAEASEERTLMTGSWLEMNRHLGGGAGKLGNRAGL